MRKFEFRPWGWFITLDEGKNYKVKKIYLKPNTKLSLQYHHHRDEHWTVVDGSGKAIVNNNVFIMNDGDDMFIQWNSDRIIIYIWDANMEDGDRINLTINGKSVLGTLENY